MNNATLKNQIPATDLPFENSLLADGWKAYEKYVRKIVLQHKNIAIKDIAYWRNELFCNILIYILPVALLSVVPGVYMSFSHEIPLLGIFDLLAFVILMVTTLKSGIEMEFRKMLFISCLYAIAVVLLYYLGNMGPGLLYLLALTVTTTVLFSSEAAYYSVLSNIIICIFFGILIHYGLDAGLLVDYSVGSWIAVSSNLVVLSLVSAICLNLLFKGLETNINEKETAEQRLKTTYERLSFHIENTSLGFIEWDNKLNIQSLSKRTEEIFGWTQTEFKEKQNKGYTHVYKEDLHWVSKITQQLLNGSVERNTVQHRSYTKNGNVIWCEWFHSVLKDETGKVITILSLVKDITELKRQEDNLKQSEAKLKQAQKIAHIGHWELSFATGEAIWSEEACRIYGLDPNDNLQSYDAWVSFLHPADLDYVMKITKEAQKTFNSSSFDHRILRRDGTVRYIHAETKFEFDTNGKPIGLYGINLDITAQKLHEEKLRQSNLMMDEAQSIAKAGSFEVDMVNNIVHWSNEQFRIIGYEPNEIVPDSESLLSMVHPDDSERVLKEYGYAFETFTNSENSFRLIRRDGMVRHIICKWKFELDANHIPLRLYGIIQDVTEKKQINQIITENEERLREAQAIAHIGNWEIDLIHNTSTWSDELYRIFGIEKVTPSPELFASLIYSEDAEYARSKIKEAFDTCNNSSCNCRFVHKNGEVRHGYSEWKFEFDKNNKPVRVYGIVQDITELKRAQEELENMLQELELRVEHRTIALKTANEMLKDEVCERIKISEMLSEKNKDITDSIIYAQRLQKALLPDKPTIEKSFKELFIFNRAKSIVSGDFHWFHKHGRQIMIACADATGHGVPGAFMSILGTNLLNRIVVDQGWTHPSLVFDMLDEELCTSLNKDQTQTVADGMDMVFCQIDQTEKKIKFAAAMNSIVLVSRGKPRVYKGSRFSLGMYMGAGNKRFETQIINYNEGDMLYMFSDGFRDQFGGEKGKKFSCKRLINLFEQVHHLPANEQQQEMTYTFDKWKGNNVQVDDVLVMGIRL